MIRISQWSKFLTKSFTFLKKFLNLKKNKEVVLMETVGMSVIAPDSADVTVIEPEPSQDSSSKKKLPMLNFWLLKDINLKFYQGNIYALLGSNGSGKSTIGRAIAGAYPLVRGSIFLGDAKSGISIENFSPDQRANAGIFLAFQNPVSIPGVSNREFLLAIENQYCRFQGLPELSPTEFSQKIDNMREEIREVYGLFQEKLLDRDINFGFSGGEKKINELLQILLLKPRLIILDELDSGLDRDAFRIFLRVMFNFIGRKVTVVIITHNDGILDNLPIDYVYLLKHGRIVSQGGKNLISKIQRNGYS